LSPLLSNVALSVLDEHFARAPGGPASTSWGRAKRRRQDLPNYRLVRYADDWTLMVAGTRNDAVALREEAAQVLARIGLRLSEEKTLITHIDEGLDFLGWRIQRHRKRGTNQHYVYTYPSRKALRAAMAKVRMWCRQVDTNQPLDVLLARINPLLQGWTAFFRPGVSSATFQYLGAYVWRRVARWIRRKHPGISRKEFRRRYCGGGWQPRGRELALFNAGTVTTTRYRYRGSAIPSPWPLAAA
jgi:RNA-directed DNA polymerase